MDNKEILEMFNSMPREEFELRIKRYFQLDDCLRVVNEIQTSEYINIIFLVSDKEEKIQVVIYQNVEVMNCELLKRCIEDGKCPMVILNSAKKIVNIDEFAKFKDQICYGAKFAKRFKSLLSDDEQVLYQGNMERWVSQPFAKR